MNKRKAMGKIKVPNCVKQLGTYELLFLSDGHFQILIRKLQGISSFNQLTHCPYATDFQLIIKNHQVGILTTLQ